jgi:K+-sensing histidine kinase KdpD
LSTFMGIGPVVVASTVSALAWNYLFIPPQFTFHIEKTEDILIFGLFYIIAFVNGVLTTRVRKQEKLVREREKRTNALFQLTKELSKSSGIDEVLEVAIREINNQFGLNSFFILQDGNSVLDSKYRLNPETKLSNEDFEVAEWVFKQSEKAGAFTPNTFSNELTFFPLLGTKLNPGVLIVKLNEPFINEQKTYWDTFTTQICNALEREFLGELAQKVRLLDESDRLYKTLFNSISHELRIPIATIMGASDSILHSSNSNTIQSALCQEIFTASMRLNRLIENLLNMSRLESGHILVRLDWYDINDLINKVTEDLDEELKSFSLEVNVPEEMPLVKIDFGLLEQVLYNLLFNSTQFASDKSTIKIKTNYEKGLMMIEVIDQGPGFPESDIQNVFKKFFRVDGRKTGGLGLGLSIVKGFIEAHNGRISVENNKTKGAKFTIAIPTELPEINNM